MYKSNRKEFKHNNNNYNSNLIITILWYIENSSIVRTVYWGIFSHIQGHSAIFSNAQAYWGTLQHIEAYWGIIEAHGAIISHIQNS